LERRWREVPYVDEVVAGLGAEFPVIHKTYALSTGAPDLPDVQGAEFILAGWSTQRSGSQAEGYFIKASAGKLTDIAVLHTAEAKYWMIEGVM
jgi:hypothetical protein